MEHYVTSQLKAMTQMMEMFRTVRILYSGDPEDCSQSRMRVSAVRESFKAQVLTTEGDPKKINSLMLTQLDYLTEMVTDSYRQGLIINSTNLNSVMSDMASLSESLRSLIRCEVRLEKQLSPQKYSGSSSEDDFYSSMKAGSSGGKKEETNIPKNNASSCGPGQVLIIERSPGVCLYKKEKCCQTVKCRGSPL